MNVDAKNKKAGIAAGLFIGVKPVLHMLCIT